MLTYRTGSLTSFWITPLRVLVMEFQLQEQDLSLNLQVKTDSKNLITRWGIILQTQRSNCVCNYTFWMCTKPKHENFSLKPKNNRQKVKNQKPSTAIFTVPSCKCPVLARSHVIPKIPLKLLAQNVTEWDRITRQVKQKGICHLRGQQHFPCNYPGRQLAKKKQSSLDHTSQLVGILVMQHYEKLALAPYVACD